MIPLPGGFQPRAAVGYMFVVALEVAALAGVGESLRTEIDVAAAARRAAGGGVGAGLARGLLAKPLARKLHGPCPRSPARA